MIRIVCHDAVPAEAFPGGATYQTLIGDDAGSTPVRCGIQTSPPGYATPNHAHPYDEVLTVLDGTGEAWAEGENGPIALAAGTTVMFPANVAHGFRVTGAVPLRTYGIHVSPDRIVEVRD
ncbi:MAG: cupin domain-containing protein [Rhodospirillaceae bacterium]